MTKLEKLYARVAEAAELGLPVSEEELKMIAEEENKIIQSATESLEKELQERLAPIQRVVEFQVTYRPDIVGSTLELCPIVPLKDKADPTPEKNAKESKKPMTKEAAEEELPEGVLAQHKSLSQFVLRVMTYFYKQDKLEAVMPFIRNGHHLLIAEKENYFYLPGIFVNAKKTEINKRNKATTRWHEQKFKVSKGTFFLSTQWRKDGAGGLQLSQLEKMITLLYGPEYVISMDDNVYRLSKQEITEMNDENDHTDDDYMIIRGQVYYKGNPVEEVMPESAAEKSHGGDLVFTHSIDWSSFKWGSTIEKKYHQNIVNAVGSLKKGESVAVTVLLNGKEFPASFGHAKFTDRPDDVYQLLWAKNDDGLKIGEILLRSHRDLFAFIKAYKEKHGTRAQVKNIPAHLQAEYSINKIGENRFELKV